MRQSEGRRLMRKKTISGVKKWWETQGRGDEKTKREGPEILDRLKSLLEGEKIPYRVIPHEEAYTSPEIAQSIHASGRKVAKVVIVRTDSHYAMAVLPSHKQLDLYRFAMVVGVDRVTITNESELAGLFPDCDPGAMPPFGGLYGLSVYVDESLARGPVIFFQAGSHRHVIELRYQDFIALVRPTVDRFVVEPFRKVSGF
ncbi:MAG TPA: YbaK/EbsC family protein [Nitrospiria bacterium]|nr:YbaK/EbsC family protein [Candidatus Manganitrophaceae bacterium]HIL34858.1 YbaK/EbsC family protein [Candidatus Manganitrophaceae bacterium]